MSCKRVRFPVTCLQLCWSLPPPTAQRSEGSVPEEQRAAEIRLEFWQKVLAHGVSSAQQRVRAGWHRVTELCPQGSLGMLHPCRNHPRGKRASREAGWEMCLEQKLQPSAGEGQPDSRDRDLQLQLKL